MKVYPECLTTWIINPVGELLSSLYSQMTNIFRSYLPNFQNYADYLFKSSQIPIPPAAPSVPSVVSPKQSVEPAIYHVDDPIFGETGSLPVMRAFISVNKAEEQVPSILKYYQLTRDQLHKAQIFHGSSSASLLAFTNYCDRRGSLVPVPPNLLKSTHR